MLIRTKMGFIEDVVPDAARELVANGAADYVNAPKKKQPEVAVAPVAQNASMHSSLYRRGPRTLTGLNSK